MQWPQVIKRPVFPITDRRYAPQHSGFVAEAVHFAPPPEPVRPGDFWNVGKDPRHAWPYRYVYRTDNSASSLSIMALPGAASFPTIPSAMVVRGSTFTPHQAQNSVRESVSLVTPQPTSWGSQRELAPLVGMSPAYAKLMS